MEEPAKPKPKPKPKRELLSNNQFRDEVQLRLQALILRLANDANRIDDFRKAVQTYTQIFAEDSEQ